MGCRINHAIGLEKNSKRSFPFPTPFEAVKMNELIA
jgi:hypothetical protein